MTSVFPNPASTAGASESILSETLSSLTAKLNVESAKTQLQVSRELAGMGEPGNQALMTFLRERTPPTTTSCAATVVDGAAYQVLFAAQSAEVADFLRIHFPRGVVPLSSEKSVNYLPLQQALAAQEFQAADRLTMQTLCELAGDAAVQRKWLYFSEIKSLPVTDLRTVDTLWRIYSEGKFGFSVQRQLWLSAGKNWDMLWVTIGWKSGNNWTRYPNGFTWNLTAPSGHLPLSNQLRGVQVLASLFSHPTWDT